MRHTVLGGGLAGLTAAVALARNGAEVDLYEQRHELGGRAITTHADGARLNLGPHAVYKDGLMLRTLAEWGIELRGGTPDLRGNAFFADTWRGERHGLPTGLAGVAMSGAMTVREKLDFAAAYSKLGRAKDTSGTSVAQWLDEHVSTEGARRVLQTLIRVSTYADEFSTLAVGATAEQLALSAGGVLYLDGGWESIIHALAAEAQRLGVRIHLGQSVGEPGQGLKPGTILAVPPATVEQMTGAGMGGVVPLRMATLDLVLDGLPDGAAHFALAVDAPLYFSVHSQWANLAPQGQMVVHAAKYLKTGAGATRQELESWCDFTMPGWRDRLVHARYLPDMTVVHAAPGVAGRPGVDALESGHGVLLAGDWVGGEGMLADAAVASGLAASKLAQRQAVAA